MVGLYWLVFMVFSVTLTHYLMYQNNKSVVLNYIRGIRDRNSDLNLNNFFPFSLAKQDGDEVGLKHLAVAIHLFICLPLVILLTPILLFIFDSDSFAMSILYILEFVIMLYFTAYTPFSFCQEYKVVASEIRSLKDSMNVVMKSDRLSQKTKEIEEAAKEIDAFMDSHINK